MTTNTKPTASQAAASKTPQAAPALKTPSPAAGASAPEVKAAAPAAKKTPSDASKKPVAATPRAAASSAAKTVKPQKAEIPEKPKKIKMIRDSFTMPEADYAQLAELKKKCLKAGIHAKKSELLRAGLLSLSTLSDSALLKAVEQVEKLKTGRPAKQ